MENSLDQTLSKLIKENSITGIAQDSRLVKTGDLFIAACGAKQKGHDFIVDAVEKGAKAVIYDDIDNFVVPKVKVPCVALKDLPKKISYLAGNFYGNPSKKMQVVGITGTNGKTTISQLLAQLLDLLDYKCGIIGTLGSGFYSNLDKSNNTTPNACDTQAILASMLRKKAKACAMEVSSHALTQYRVEAVDFSIAVFSNLSRDHLDYHGDMSSYAAAKAKLFVGNSLTYRIVNIDDSCGKLLAVKVPARAVNSNLITYSVNNKSADVYCYSLQLTSSGISADIIALGQKGSFNCSLLGEFNLSNLLAVIGVALALDFSLPQITSKISKLVPPSGRVQKVESKGKPQVVVDYAHTPDALEQILKALRPHTSGKLICVFGCGGDRDKGKRALMAHVSGIGADLTIVTADNSRTESIKDIFADIKAGFRPWQSFKFIEDRGKAIEEAILSATKDDLVLIAGKGHETYQDIAGVKHDFSDVEQAKKYLALWQKK